MGKVHYTVVMTYYKLIRRLRNAGVEPSPQTIRTTADTFASLYPMPLHTRLERITLGGQPCGVVSHRTPTAKAVFMFIHGGGFAFGSMNTHRVAIGHLCKLTGMMGYLPEYRLAPEHHFPAPLDDCINAYLELRQIHPNYNVYLMGDSAGGNLAASMVVRLKDEGVKLPDGLVLMSPWLDLRPDSESIARNRDDDSLFDAHDLVHYSKYYLAGHDAQHPLLSPLLADLRGFPDTLIQVAENELLYYDSLRFCERLRAAGVNVDFAAEPALFHSWQLFPDFVPEARTSLKQAADFVKNLHHFVSKEKVNPEAIGS